MFASIDWSRPGFDSIRDAANSLRDQADWRSALNAASGHLGLRNHRGLPIRFVEPAQLPAQVAYEAFISDTGCVPTRNNLHDFFNALVWLSFPATKQTLNALQAGQIAQHGIRHTRGAARDTATLFDENAALFVVRDIPAGHELESALRQHEWQNLFIAGRTAFTTHIEVWLFGHALMEKLVSPFKAITAHAWTVRMPDEYFLMSHQSKRLRLDQMVAEQLAASSGTGIDTSRLTPLPVMGIPGWHAAQDPAFYDDNHVFRPQRTVK
jgi:hypothetical protein